jgi:hypothetical protein
VKVPEPTPESVELARSILDQDGDPFVDYLAATIGRVMELNYNGLAEIFKEHGREFEARGAEDLLRKIRADVDNLFSGFVEVGGE